MAGLLNRPILVVLACVSALAGCGSSSSSSAMPPQAQSARVRFAQGAPELETMVGSVVLNIGSAYLQVDGKTAASAFNYGTFTPFLAVPAGVHSIVARDEAGYAVGPLKTSSLSPGGRYTLILVGTFPNYQVLTFAEPATSKDAQLSLYEASPAVPQAGFGSFVASSHSGFKQLGSAKLGSVVTVNLGERASNFGGFIGTASTQIGTITPSQINSFNAHNVLPFHAVSSLSLFLFDIKGGSPPTGPVFGSLDK
jgi:hypothetical protein